MTATRNVGRFVAIIVVFLVPAILVAAWLRDYGPEGAGHDGMGGVAMGGMQTLGEHRDGPALAPSAAASGEPSARPAEPTGHSQGGAPPDAAPTVAAPPTSEPPPPAQHHPH